MERARLLIAVAVTLLAGCNPKSDETKFLPRDGVWLFQSSTSPHADKTYMTWSSEALFRKVIFVTGETGRKTHFRMHGGKFHADQVDLGKDWPKNIRKMYGEVSPYKVVIETEDYFLLIRTHRKDTYTFLNKN